MIYILGILAVAFGIHVINMIFFAYEIKKNGRKNAKINKQIDIFKGKYAELSVKLDTFYENTRGIEDLGEHKKAYFDKLSSEYVETVLAIDELILNEGLSKEIVWNNIEEYRCQVSGLNFMEIRFGVKQH